jgi:hypothetical protein
VNKKRFKSGDLMIRLATDKDYAGCLAVLRSHHSRTLFASYEFSERRFRDQFHSAVNTGPHSLALLAEREGNVTGCAWATLGRYAMSDELKLTTVHVIAVNNDLLGPLGRARTFNRLLQGVRKWSKANGGEHVLVHVTTGRSHEATHKLMRASGAIAIGGAYQL